jgi:hypothetical protein
LESRARQAEAKIRLLERTLAVSPLSAEELSALELSDLAAPATMHAASSVQASIRIRNHSGKVISSLGTHPVNISYHWLSKEGAIVHHEGCRTELYPPLPSGTNCDYTFSVQSPDAPGDFILRATLVQELVTWLDSYGVYCDQDCTVLE